MTQERSEQYVKYLRGEVGMFSGNVSRLDNDTDQESEIVYSAQHVQDWNDILKNTACRLRLTDTHRAVAREGRRMVHVMDNMVCTNQSLDLQPRNCRFIIGACVNAVVLKHQAYMTLQDDVDAQSVKAFDCCSFSSPR